ncbi:MAG: amidase [Alphaproteobacteria bacterium]|nr:amidase [Alphaproteobacteria bacterium]MCY4320239.1 amidase [Alphaproteobacteria bacterium]
MSALLDVKGLRAGYGRAPVLHGIDLSVERGEIVGVLGHNGMGKTTLLKTLMGLLPAQGGTIIYSGLDLTRERSSARARLGLGYVPQGRGIFPNLSVYDNIRMGIVALDLDEEGAVRRILAEFPRLERLLDREGGALSGGEQQLLAIARCLVSEPELILLDEPTEGIQPSIVDEIIDLLRELNRRRGVAIVLVEQSLDFITELSDRVLLLQKGEITGVIAGSDAANSALIEEFTGFGGGPARSREQDTSPVVETGTKPPASRVMPASRPVLSERTAFMTAQRPTHAQIKDIVEELGMHLSDARIQEFLDVMQGTLDAYDVVDSMPDYLPPVLYPRTAGIRPTPEENPLNAWYVKTEVRGAPRGPLLGRSVALKDNICLAGVPMMNGASTLKGYTPDVDATIVTRLLDAGAVIMGKAHCEYFCLSGGSHTSAAGPVQNPHKAGYSAGGSSSGSGALVGGGHVDMAIGGDQGGSIRMPASFCGCYGLKPTHGLVPYTGVMPIETTIDHTGPLTRTVMDNALMLEVLAGPDGLDPRQYNVTTDRYTQAVTRGASGLKIGIVKEGFGRAESEPDVDAKVRAAADMLAGLGAAIDEISIPWHLKGPAIWTPIALEGLTNQMMHGNGMGTGWEGMYTTSLLDFHANWRQRADELSDTLKISMFIGQYYLKHHRGHYYAKAQNLSRRLREEYDKVFASYDLLLMPTTPMKATPIPESPQNLALWCQRAFEMLNNTAPFDVTGHPAMAVPCGMSDGLPVSMMLVAKHCDESTIYRAAGAFEAVGDWNKM